MTIGLYLLANDLNQSFLRSFSLLLPTISEVIIQDLGLSTEARSKLQDLLTRSNRTWHLLNRPADGLPPDANQALKQLKSNPDVAWLMVLDSGDELIADSGALEEMQHLDEQCKLFYILTDERDIEYEKVVLAKSPDLLHFDPVTAEFLRTSADARSGRLSGIRIQQPLPDARNPAARERLARKIADLKNTLQHSRENERKAHLLFMLARAETLAGNSIAAFELHGQRMQIEGRPEETYWSIVEFIRLGEVIRQRLPLVKSVQWLLKAVQLCPDRVEAFFWLTKIHMDANQHDKAYQFSDTGRRLKHPLNRHCTRPGMYHLGMPLLAAQLATKQGKSSEAAAIAAELLGTPGLSSEAVRAAGLVIQQSTARMAATPKMDTTGKPPMLVSIITPTRNRETFLPFIQRCVENQTYPHIEWLVLDNSAQATTTLGSSTKVVTRYEHDPTAMSIGALRNRLVEKAQGELIVHFDDDDYYSPCYISDMVEMMHKHKLDLINLSGFFVLDLKNRFFGFVDSVNTKDRHFVLDGKNPVLTADFSQQENPHLDNSGIGYGFSYCYKKEVWLQGKFPDQNWKEDYEFASAASRKFRLGHFQDSKGLTLHAIHGMSTSRCFSQYRIPERLLKVLFPEYHGFSKTTQLG
ncbi:MAG TPA: glycosyltransferase family A protein [Limnobacter sp.]|nr:glycosyltransferase family A protein [Limnobacter sp.]